MNDDVRKDIEALRSFLVDDCIDFPHVIHTALHKAADLIESLSAQLDQVTRERDAAESNKFQYETGFVKGFEAAYPKWISVKERLPEPFVSVLVHIPEEEPLPQVHEGFITPDGTWCSVLYVETYGRVAHWMPMPEMPEEGE